MSFLDTILSIFFPIKCISCEKNGENLCLECLASSPGVLRECEEWIFPFFDYRDKTIKKAISLLKYGGKRSLARVFAEVMYGRIAEELADLNIMENFDNALLIPIPLSKKRLRERGFNQSLLIAQNLIEIDERTNHILPTLTLEKNVLIKPKETTHQAHIKNREERLKNIVGSFALKNENLIKDKNIILIDDVTTTGATLSEAKKILKRAGAKKVIAFTVAH